MKKWVLGFIGGLIILLAGYIFFVEPATFFSPLSSSFEQGPFFKPSIATYTPDRVSLAIIFADNHDWVATLSGERIRTIVATGDVIVARVVNIQTTKRDDFAWPFEKTADFLKSADVTFINLEAPLTEDCPMVNEGFKFCGDARHVEGLVFAGIDVASIANNHAGNYGIEGIENTTQLLSENNILVAGRNKTVYKNVRGIKFAFLGYNDIGYEEKGISWTNDDVMRSEIAEARKNADVVIVGVHWGAEYQSQPDKRQIDLGHLIVDSGADIVIGNHPHWIQPVEVYKDKLIVYAHGNFVFDQEWSQETKEGVVGKYTFYDDSLIDVEFLPIFIEDWGQPYFLEGEEKRAILGRMKKESIILSNL
ncbi:CapA family protein [Candidatus Gottesmanbacteria bacterium]|nr:CapA family protein [Candidatus Gottesmanbacteria bacterium]